MDTRSFILGKNVIEWLPIVQECAESGSVYLFNTRVSFCVEYTADNEKTKKQL